MKAVAIKAYPPIDDPSSFHDVDQSKGRDVMVAVQAVAVDPVGSEVTLFRLGDQVWYAGESDAGRAKGKIVEGF